MGDRSSRSMLMVGDSDFIQLLQGSVIEYSARTAADAASAWPLFRPGSTGVLVVQICDRTVSATLDLIDKCRRSDPRLIIFAVSNSAVPRAVAAFEVGANDYMAYPIPLDEFRIRLQRLIDDGRLLSGPQEEGVIQIRASFYFGCVEVRPDLALRFPDGSEEFIRAKHVGILRIFADRPGELVLKDDLIRSVWGWDGRCYGNSVNEYISILRRLFKQHNLDFNRWVVGVPKAGWRVDKSVAYGPFAAAV